MDVSRNERVTYDLSSLSPREMRVIMRSLGQQRLNTADRAMARVLQSQMIECVRQEVPIVGPEAMDDFAHLVQEFTGAGRRLDPDDVPETNGMCKPHEFKPGTLGDPNACLGELYQGTVCLRPKEHKVHDMKGDDAADCVAEDPRTR